jgi:hypothetical protein
MHLTLKTKIKKAKLLKHNCNYYGLTIGQR